MIAITQHSRSTRGMILILVLMIALGLVTVTLYFADAMILEYRGSDNEMAGLMAGQANAGACRYVISMLKNQVEKGRMPRIEDYRAEAEPVGEEAQFWLIGRDPNAEQPADRPTFGLVDEASKLNINSLKVTQTMLEALPGMTSDLAASIITWRSEDTGTDTSGGAQSSTYLQLNPAYQAKNASFETAEELRLVYGATWAILFGEDANRNGVLDLNENDGGQTPPTDNRDGKLDPGVLEYVTVFSREPNTQKDGTKRINIRGNGAQTSLRKLLTDNLNQTRANQIITALGTNMQAYDSVLRFYKRSGMTTDEFAKVEDALTVTNDEYTTGPVNVNTAPEAVLACLPGLNGTSHAAELVAYRRGKTPDALTSIAWVTNVLDDATAFAVGPYITTRSYQFSADVVSLGRAGRGMRRELFVIDTTNTNPRVIYHRDLGRSGWPLGSAIREELRMANQS